jgi:hypothetical protein
MNEQIKNWIDNASYQELLSYWRNAPMGDYMFHGEAGDYYSKVMQEKRQTVDHVQVSKDIGWNK